MALKHFQSSLRASSPFARLHPIPCSEEERLRPDFAGADFESWCLEAGFKRCEVLPLAGPASAAIAYK